MSTDSLRLTQSHFWGTRISFIIMSYDDCHICNVITPQHHDEINSVNLLRCLSMVSMNFCNAVGRGTFTSSLHGIVGIGSSNALSP